MTESCASTWLAWLKPASSLCVDWVENTMVPYYPLGIKKRPEDGPGPGRGVDED